MKSSSVSEWVNKICPKCISLVMVQNPRRVNYCEKCGSKLEMTPQSGKIKSPPFNLERFKETAQKAKETFGTDNSVTLGYTKILTESDKTKKEILDKLIELAEQRGYERAKRELAIKYGGQG